MLTKKFSKIVCASMLLTLSSYALANDALDDPFANVKQNQNAPTATQVPVNNTNQNTEIVIPAPPTFDAESWVLMDYSSGQVLFEKDAHKKIWPASLTKMMTSYVIGQEIKSGRLKLDDEVVIPKDAWAKNDSYSDSSKMFIEVGKKITVDELNKGIIIQSGNDACVAMALHLAGTQEGFVSVMNTYAKHLGLNNTHFSNVHGLFDEENYSTAYDMALLSRALIRDLPEEYAVYSQKEFKFNGIKQINRNRLLWDTTMFVDGIKTGHLSAVGYNLAASAVQDNMRLISVLIGAKSESSRAQFSKQMLSYGFRFFQNYTPFEENQTILTREVRMGMTNKVALAIKDVPTMMIPRGSQNNIKINYTLKSPIFRAPINEGDELGVIEFRLNDKLIARHALIAKNSVKEGGFFGRLWDRMYLFFTSSKE